MSFVWEPGMRPSEEELMHWGIPGMKHGRRRYQNEDGTWTEAGLAERRKREGFGESRKELRAEKALAKAEKKAAKSAARAEAREAAAEKRRKKDLSGLTDEELQKKIERAKMEQEYKELTKSPVVKSGEFLVNKLLDYKERKEQRVVDLNRQKLEQGRIAVQKIQAVEGRKRAEADAEAAKYKFKEQKQSRKEKRITKRTDLLEAKKNLQNAKTAKRTTTLLGAISRAANKRVDYRAEERMNPINVKKHQRTVELQKLQIEALKNGGGGKKKK